VKNNFIY